MSARIQLGVISRYVRIAGLVRNAETHQGMAGVNVEITEMPARLQAKVDLLANLYRGDWENRTERLDRTQTRPDGYFYFLDMPNGDYTLKASWLQAGTRYDSAEIQRTLLPNHDANITGPAIVTIDLPPTSLKGTITDESSQAVVMAKVQLQGSGEYSYSDRNGNYILIGLEASDHERQVTAIANGYQYKVEQIVLNRGEVRTLSMELSS